MFEQTSELLRAFLETAVTLHVAELRRQGGPTAADLSRVRESLPLLLEHGDALFFKEKGRTGQVATAVAEAMAVLAFAPGGVTAFGLHFEG